MTRTHYALIAVLLTLAACQPHTITRIKTPDFEASRETTFTDTNASNLEIVTPSGAKVAVKGMTVTVDQESYKTMVDGLVKGSANAATLVKP